MTLAPIPCPSVMIALTIARLTTLTWTSWTREMSILRKLGLSLAIDSSPE